MFLKKGNNKEIIMYVVLSFIQFVFCLCVLLGVNLFLFLFKNNHISLLMAIIYFIIDTIISFTVIVIVGKYKRILIKKMKDERN